jgi:hypothetical protein
MEHPRCCARCSATIGEPKQCPLRLQTDAAALALSACKRSLCDWTMAVAVPGEESAASSEAQAKLMFRLPDSASKGSVSGLWGPAALGWRHRPSSAPDNALHPGSRHTTSRFSLPISHLRRSPSRHCDIVTCFPTLGIPTSNTLHLKSLGDACTLLSATHSTASVPQFEPHVARPIRS